MPVRSVPRTQDPAGRLLHLLSLLQSRPDWLGEALADRLGVTTRTVRRDVDRLRRLGYPVEASPGTGGGYRLGVGARLPPLLLDDDEAVAVAIGLRTAAGGTVVGLEEAAIGALAKLEQVLPAHLRLRVQAVQSATVPLRSGAPEVAASTLVLLAQACRGAERVRFDYTDGSGARTERTVEPFRLVPTGRRWYLVARDVRGAAAAPSGGSWRTFRADRIAEPKVTGHRFTLEDPPDAAALVSSSVGVAPYAHHAVVRIEAAADVVAAAVPPTVGVVEPAGTDRSTLRTGADHLDAILGHLVLLGHDFEVLEPPALRERAVAVGRRLVHSHRRSSR